MPFKNNQNLIGCHHILGVCPRNLTRLCAPNCFLVESAGGLSRILPIPLVELFLARLWPLHAHDACTGRFPRCNLTQHEDDGEERVPVEGQGTQQEHADAQQPASIYKQAPRNQAQERHPYRGDA